MRIIPTRMGTRDLTVKSASTSWDHPHAYGDKSGAESPATSATGSSPRVWGQGGRHRNKR